MQFSGIGRLQRRYEPSCKHPNDACLRRVSCDVCQGVVTLSGRVPSFYLKQLAQTIVLGLVSGAWVIDNPLEVDRM